MGETYGNDGIKELLAGPFLGFKLGIARATEVDGALRHHGTFSVRYFGEYVVCSGPQLVEVLEKILTPKEMGYKTYQGDTFADCIAAIFHGEKLQLSLGYAYKQGSPPRPPF